MAKENSKSHAQFCHEYREKKKDTDPYYLDKEAKRQREIYVPVKELSKVKKRKKREKDRLASQRYRNRRKEKKLASIPVNLDFPNSAQKGINATRKRTAHTAEEVKTLQKQLDVAQRRIWKLTKRNQRKKTKEQKGKPLTPKNAARVDLKTSGLEPAKHPILLKKLTSHHALLAQMKAINQKRFKNEKKISESILAGNIIKRYRSLTYLGKMTMTNRNHLGKGRKERPQKKRLPQARAALKKKVITFYNRDDVSRVKPGMRDYTRVDNEKTQTRVLLDYQMNNWMKFKDENPDEKICKSVLSSLRPPNVHLTKYTDREECLCQYHQNVALKLKALSIPGSPDYLITNYSTDDIIAMSPVTAPSIRFYEWGRVKENDHLITKCLQKESPHDEFMATFRKELERFCQHVHRIHVQYQAIRELKETLSPSEAIIYMDFAENYGCHHQKAVQSSYWNLPQLSVHPVVIYYKPENEELQHKTNVYVSDSTDHNTASIFTIMKMMQKDLDDLNVKEVHYVTDGPTSQYRNRTIFHLVANHTFIFKKRATWHYHEAGHGKSACDGVGGTVKRQLSEGVRQGKAVVQCAEDACAFFKNKRNTSMAFVLYNQCDVDASAHCLKKMDPAPVPGTMSLHAVHQATTPGVLAVRNTSCYCHRCRQKDFCEGWKMVKVSREMNLQEPEGLKESTQEDIHTEKGHYVAVKYQGEYYVGQVVKDERGKKRSLMTFLINSTFNPALFKWPASKDTLTVDHEDMLCNVALQPQASGPKKEDQVFSMDEATLKKVKYLYEKSKEF